MLERDWCIGNQTLGIKLLRDLRNGTRLTFPVRLCCKCDAQLRCLSILSFKCAHARESGVRRRGRGGERGWGERKRIFLLKLGFYSLDQ